MTLVKPVENLKEKNCFYSCKIIIRDKAHFAKIVKWLNAYVGPSREKWTMSGKVLRKIEKGSQPTVTIYIMVEDFDEESFLYLSLI